MKRLGLTATGLLCLAISAHSQETEDLKADLDALLELFQRSMSDRATRWQCRLETQYVCSAEGCKQVEPSVWLNVDFRSQVYERCDAKGCDTRSMTASESGIYTIVSEAGFLLKALNDGSEFMDVATSGTAAWNGFGSCVPR